MVGAGGEGWRGRGRGVTLFVGVNELAEADSRNPENAARPARSRSAAFPERARVTRDIKLIMRERSALAAAEAKRPALINSQTRRTLRTLRNSPGTGLPEKRERLAPLKGIISRR